MRLVRYSPLDGPATIRRWGRIHEDRVLPLPGLADAAGFEDVLTAATRHRDDPLPADAVALSGTVLHPPLTDTATVYCVGINYRAHASEAGREAAPHPSIFIRRLGSLTGADRPLACPAESVQFDFEGELAVVIGRAGRRIAADDAMAHVAAYTIVNDGSVRDYQKHSVTAGKNFEGSGACGPWLVTADEVGDAGDLLLETRLNGEVMQRARTSALIHSIPNIISYVSRFARLMPGDVIATGTPEGVGAARVPPVWMKAGDRVEVEVERVGRLGNWVGVG